MLYEFEKNLRFPALFTVVAHTSTDFRVFYNFLDGKLFCKIRQFLLKHHYPYAKRPVSGRHGLKS
jgi:hypothetical protein